VHLGHFVFCLVISSSFLSRLHIGLTCCLGLMFSRVEMRKRGLFGQKNAGQELSDNLYSLHSSTCFRVIHVPIDSVSAEYYEVAYEGSRSKVSVWVSFFVCFAD